MLRRNPQTGDIDKNQLLLQLSRPREVVAKYGKTTRGCGFREFTDQMHCVNTEKRAFVNNMTTAQNHVRRRLSELRSTIVQHERDQHAREMIKTRGNAVDVSDINPLLSTLKFDDMVNSVRMKHRVSDAGSEQTGPPSRDRHVRMKHRVSDAGSEQTGPPSRDRHPRMLNSVEGIEPKKNPIESEKNAKVILDTHSRDIVKEKMDGKNGGQIASPNERPAFISRMPKTTTRTTTQDTSVPGSAPKDKVPTGRRRLSVAGIDTGRRNSIDGRRKSIDNERRKSIDTAIDTGRRRSLIKLPPMVLPPLTRASFEPVLHGPGVLRKKYLLGAIQEDEVDVGYPPAMDPNVRRFSEAINIGGFNRRGSIMNPYLSLPDQSGYGKIRQQRKKKLTKISDDKMKERKKIIGFFEENKNKPSQQKSAKQWKKLKSYALLPSHVKKSLDTKQSKVFMYLGIDSNEKLQRFQSQCLLKTEKSFYGRVENELENYYSRVEDCVPPTDVVWRGTKHVIEVAKPDEDNGPKNKSGFKV